MNAITLTGDQWRHLTGPVVPFAADATQLPVLNAVHVHTAGRWLIATATDRIRAAMKRIEKQPTDDDDTDVWPEFEALIPLRAVKSITTMLKPTRNQTVSAVDFTVEADRLTVEARGSFDLFDDATFTHYLQSGEYPNVARLFADALAVPDDQRSPVATVNPALLAALPKTFGPMRLIGPKSGEKLQPMLATDDRGFLALIMQRIPTPHESWADVLPVSADVTA